MFEKAVSLAASLLISVAGHLSPSTVTSPGPSVPALSQEELSSFELLGPAHEPEEVLVAYCPAQVGKSQLSNGDFIKHLAAILTKINEKRPRNKPIHLRILNADERFLKETLMLEKNPYVRGDAKVDTQQDLWMRDICKVGVMKCRDTKQPLHRVVLDTNRQREAAQVPRVWAKAHHADYINLQNPPSAGDYGGNIDVTPSGIAYIGSTSSSTMYNFLSDHYEDNLVELDTDWLSVGHVDEQVNTILDPSDPCGFQLVKASPLMALAALDEVRADELAMLAPLLNSPVGHLKSYALYRNAVRSSGLYSDPTHPNYQEARQFEQTQIRLEEIIGANIAKLKARVEHENSGCKELKVISLPVFYGCSGTIQNAQGQEVPQRCESILPNVVNFESLGQDLIVPNPLLPAFKRITQNQLMDKGGQQVHLLEDLCYHNLAGEVHCGTNTMRSPNRIKL